MPVAFATQFETAEPVIRRKRWTREEIATLEKAAGWDTSRLELIEGELIEKVPKNHPHSYVLSCLLHWFAGLFERVYVEAVIDVSPEDNPTSGPQPDLTVMKAGHAGFRQDPPRPSEIAVVVEVADSSLDYDLRVKGGLYARAGIAEYWVMDINSRRLIVHRDPVGGVYQSVVAYGETEGVATLAAPDHAIAVREMLP